MDIIYSILAYTTPLIVLPFILIRAGVSSAKRVALIVLFIAPLVGEITYLISTGTEGFAALKSLDFWKTVSSFYPMALIPLGLWAALLGAIGTRALDAIALRFRFQFTSMLLVSVLLGALIGISFMAVFAATAVLSGVANELNEGLMPYTLAGLTAGGVSGAIAAYLSKRSITGPA